MAYIDTSVLVAYYCPEPLSRAAQEMIRKASSPAVSLLTEVEFCSALSLKTRTGDMDTDTAASILSVFRSHLEGGQYRIVPIGAGEYTLACEWISCFSAPLRTVDALHLAAAFSQGMTLLTADRGLARSARQFKVKHKLIS